MKGSPEARAEVQRMRVIAAECRAAATRIRLAARPTFCYSVILNEAQRHEALVDGSGFLPAFEALPATDDFCTRVSPHSPCFTVLARLMTPMSMSTHCIEIPVCAPGKFHVAEAEYRYLLRHVWNSRAEYSEVVKIGELTQAKIDQAPGCPLSRDDLLEIRRAVPNRVSKEPDLKTLELPEPPTFVAAREADAALACGLVSEALVTMAEYLDFLVRSPESVAQRGNVRLSVDAWDVLAMLWKLKAFGERRARSLKQAALEDMPKRKNSRKPSTIEKAAQMGFKELKSAGLALARPNVGSWLTPEGRELAQSRWGSRSKK